MLPQGPFDSHYVLAFMRRAMRLLNTGTAHEYTAIGIRLFELGVTRPTDS